MSEVQDVICKQADPMKINVCNYTDFYSLK